MYAMRNLFVLHKHFLRYEYIAPQLSLGASLWGPSLCQHVRHHEIFQISCAWVGIAKGTHGHETSEFVTSSFCTTAHSKQSECATTFGMNSRFQLSKISCSISPSSHRNIILLDSWWRKKNPVLPNFILVISFTLYIMYIISHIGFPKLLGFIQTHPLHRATDVLQLLVGREEPELHHVGTDLLELLNPERSWSTIRGPTGQFCFRIFDVDWRCFCPFLLWIRWIWYDSNSCSLI